jgi:hypothetical protein
MRYIAFIACSAFLPMFAWADPSVITINSSNNWSTSTMRDQYGENPCSTATTQIPGFGLQYIVRDSFNLPAGLHRLRKVQFDNIQVEILQGGATSLNGASGYVVPLSNTGQFTRVTLGVPFGEAVPLINGQTGKAVPGAPVAGFENGILTVPPESNALILTNRPIVVFVNKAVVCQLIPSVPVQPSVPPVASPRKSAPTSLPLQAPKTIRGLDRAPKSLPGVNLK